MAEENKNKTLTTMGIDFGEETIEIAVLNKTDDSDCPELICFSVLEGDIKDRLDNIMDIINNYDVNGVVMNYGFGYGGNELIKNNLGDDIDFHEIKWTSGDLLSSYDRKRERYNVSADKCKDSIMGNVKMSQEIYDIDKHWEAVGMANFIINHNIAKKIEKKTPDPVENLNKHLDLLIEYGCDDINIKSRKIPVNDKGEKLDRSPTLDDLKSGQLVCESELRFKDPYGQYIKYSGDDVLVIIKEAVYDVENIREEEE